jgi:hypothetical protein
MGVDLVYCADGNPEFAAVAVSLGWRYGARLPGTVYQPVWFADQDWKRPDLGKYLGAVARHRPEVATVLDWEHDGQLPEVLAWAEAVAPFVGRVVVIPKVPGRVHEVPDVVGGKPVVLGYSVPTAYGGTNCGLWEFGRRPVHLLGGSPQSQIRYARYLNVVSADGNMAAQQARRGRYWSDDPGPKGHWCQLRDSGDHRETGVPVECFRRSLSAVMGWWVSTGRVAALRGGV